MSANPVCGDCAHYSVCGIGPGLGYCGKHKERGASTDYFEFRSGRGQPSLYVRQISDASKCNFYESKQPEEKA